MAETADLVMKRHDTSEALKVTLRDLNPLTGVWEPIDFANVVKVLFISKPRRGGMPLEKVCTAWGGGSIKSSTGPTAGQAEYPWGQTDLSPTVVPELYDMEWEIEKPAIAGVKQIQTVPSKTYKVLEVIADLGGA